MAITGSAARSLSDILGFEEEVVEEEEEEVVVVEDDDDEEGDGNDGGIPVHYLSVGVELMLDDYGFSLSNGEGPYAVDIRTDESGVVTGGVLSCNLR